MEGPHFHFILGLANEVANPALLVSSLSLAIWCYLSKIKVTCKITGY